MKRYLNSFQTSSNAGVYNTTKFRARETSPVKLVKHVVSFIGIGKELAENRRSCHQVPVASIAESSLLRLRNWQVRFQVQLLCFSLRF